MLPCSNVKCGAVRCGPVESSYDGQPMDALSAVLAITVAIALLFEVARRIGVP